MTRQTFSIWWMAALLGVVTVVLYWPATHHGFITYDDDLYVTANGNVQAGLTLANLKWAFENVVSSNWHPITMLSHMLDCQLFGLEPGGHHLTSLLLHGFNTALVFLLLRRLTGAMWRSAMVAALFGWHPLHVESVAWVAERKDVLSACFGLISLIFYAHYAQKRRAGREEREERRGGGPRAEGRCLKSEFTVFGERGPDGTGGRVTRSSLFSLPSSTPYWLALFCFAAGLMSKAMLVTWPFVMLLLDYWPLKRFQAGRIGQLVKEKIPFFALSLAASFVTFAVQKHAGAVMGVGRLPLAMRAENALNSYGRYLQKLLWPNHLSVFYPLPPHSSPESLGLEILLVGGLSLLFFLNRQRHAFLLMGWLWFLGTLVPVIGLVQVGGQAMADRYMYIPSLGIFLLTVWGICELTRSWRHQLTALSLAGAAGLALCLAMTRQQLGYWQDSETLFRHALAVTQNNYVAHNNLGMALLNKGEMDTAISQFQQAIQIEPTCVEALNNLGYVWSERGERLDQALAMIEAAHKLDPGNYHNLDSLGWVLLKLNRPAEGLIFLQQAIANCPQPNAVLYDHVGDLYAAVNRNDEAVDAWRKSLAVRPNPNIQKKLTRLLVP